MIFGLTTDRANDCTGVCHGNTECHNSQGDQSANNLKIFEHDFHPLALVPLELTRAYEGGIEALSS
jgi:hypothetical protein